jgi:hypothetical protein
MVGGKHVSRIILQRYDTGEERIVVGWDRPLDTFFWQEFAAEPRGEDGEVDWDLEPEWEEMVRYAGYDIREMPTMDQFLRSIPNDLRPLITQDVQAELIRHQEGHVDSGRTRMDMCE